jgi:hypothetical protein
MLRNEPWLPRYQRYRHLVEERLELTFFAWVDRRPEDADDHDNSS